MVVLGLDYFSGKAKNAFERARGMCVFPAAPGLMTLVKDTRYRDALLQADTRFVDSGFLALFWFLFSGERLSRISGVRFLKDFFNSPQARNLRILLVSPIHAKDRNVVYLTQRGFSPRRLSQFPAPMYPATGSLEDPALLALAKEKQPDVIIINIGSGYQEPLGLYLKQNLSSTPLIFCTGGAIDMLTGAQAPVPDWADRLFLGWLFRILATPRKEAAKMNISPSKRYWDAWRLLGMLWKWRRRMPQ